MAQVQGHGRRATQTPTPDPLTTNAAGSAAHDTGTSVEPAGPTAPFAPDATPPEDGIDLTPTGQRALPHATPELTSQTELLPQVRPAPRRAGALTGWLRDRVGRPTGPLAPLAALGAALQRADDAEARHAEQASHASDMADGARRAARVGAVLAAFAPGAPVGAHAPGAIPRAPRLIGRDAERAAALEALAEGATLCVRSDGARGLGASALAAEIVSAAAERRLFAGGVYWLDCERLVGADGLARIFTAVALALHEEAALAIPDMAGRAAALAAATLEDDRPPLLITLDQVDLDPGEMATLLDTLVGGYLTLLVTTARPFDDPRVATLAVGPLALDETIALLAERLRLRDANRPAPEEADALRQVAATLEGHPLRIELAAALAGLAGASFDTPASLVSTSLRGQFDLLWGTLDDAQRETLAGLGALAGPTFPRAVALEVAHIALDNLAQPADDTSRAARTLDALVGLGLVEAVAGARLRLCPALRPFVAERLAALPVARAQALGEGVALWWLSYARARPGFAGVGALEAEAAGLMGALEWAHQHHRARLTLDLVEALDETWRLRGRREETLRMYEWAAQAAEARGDPRERWWARYQLALAQSEAGRLDEALTGFTAALTAARELEDPVAIRDGAHALASLAMRAGRRDEARAGFEEALGLARRLDDPATIRDEVHGLALIDAQAGDTDAAIREYTEALSLARALGDPWAMYLETYGLGAALASSGESTLARAHLAEALALAQEMGNLGAAVDAAVRLGALDLRLGAAERARESLEQALAVAQGIHDPRRGARAAAWLAEAEVAGGALDAAREHYTLAAAIYERLGDPQAERIRERGDALSAGDGGRS